MPSTLETVQVVDGVGFATCVLDAPVDVGLVSHAACFFGCLLEERGVGDDVLEDIWAHIGGI